MSDYDPIPAAVSRFEARSEAASKEREEALNEVWWQVRKNYGFAEFVDAISKLERGDQNRLMAFIKHEKINDIGLFFSDLFDEEVHAISEGKV